MNKHEYIEMLLQDIETHDDVKKELLKEVIDCAEIALSQTSSDEEIDSQKGIDDLWAVIEKEGKSSKTHCVGPFRAAELIAETLGVSYTRASKKIQTKKVRDLEDFL